MKKSRDSKIKFKTILKPMPVNSMGQFVPPAKPKGLARPKPFVDDEYGPHSVAIDGVEPCTNEKKCYKLTLKIKKKPRKMAYDEEPYVEQ